MNVLTKFTLKTMNTYRKWTVVTVIGVFLSSFLLTSVSTLAFSGIRLMLDQELANAGMWTVRFDDVDRKEAVYWKSVSPDNQVSIVKEYGFAYLEGTRNQGKPYVQVSEFDGDAFRHFYIRLVDGRLPVNGTEIVLPDEVRNTSGVDIQIGQRITLKLGNRLMPDGSFLFSNDMYQKSFFYYDRETGVSKDLGAEKLAYITTRTFTVVGFIETPIGENSWSAGYRGITVPNPGTSSASDRSDRVSMYLWTDNPGFSYCDTIRTQAATRAYDDNSIVFHSEYLNLLGIDTQSGFYTTLFAALGLIVLIILISAFFLIYNSFSISVAERRRHLGLLATAGASRSQIRHYVFREGLFVGMIAIPTGMAAGVLAIALLFRFGESAFLALGGWTDMNLRLIIVPQSLIPVVLLEAFTIFLSVLLPSLKASRISPIEAIRQTEKEPRRIRFRKITDRLLRPLGIEALLAAKSYHRNRKRYRATTVSLVIGLILFLTVSSYLEFSSENLGLYGNGQNADISFSVDGISAAESYNLYAKIRFIPEVRDCALVRQTSMMLHVKPGTLTPLVSEFGYDTSYFSLSLYVMDDDSFNSYAQSVGAKDLNFSNPERPAGILYNTAEEYNFTSGRTVRGEVLNVKPGAIIGTAFYSSDAFMTDTTPAWSRVPDKDKRYFTVRSVAKTPPIGLSYTYFGSSYLIIPQSQFRLIAEGTDELASSYAYSPSIYIRTFNDRVVENALKDMCKTIPSSQIYITNFTSMNQQQQQLLFFTKLLAYCFISLISVICLANLFNTVTTTTTLRKKEYAMLRSAGMAQKSFNRMIRLESLFIGTKVLVLGIPISIACTVAIYYWQSYNYFFPISFPFMSYLVGVLLVFLLIFATMLYSVSRINRENIIDALKSDMN